MSPNPHILPPSFQVAYSTSSSAGSTFYSKAGLSPINLLSRTFSSRIRSSGSSTRFTLHVVFVSSLGLCMYHFYKAVRLDPGWTDNSKNEEETTRVGMNRLQLNQDWKG